MAQRKGSIGTTSYAILGQLAWGDASTYELVKAMGRNLRFLWPRAESRIYDEVKRLVDAGLATATAGSTGKRPRTTYAITPAGRKALAVWLGTEPGGLSLEAEPLLRVILGASGDVDDLRRAVEAVAAHADTMLGIGRPLAQEYLDGEHPQQHEVHLRALTFDYLYGWAAHNRDWARRAAKTLEEWDATTGSPDRESAAVASLRATLRRAGD